MSIDDIVCPECKSGDLREGEYHNISNFAFGLSVGTVIGTATNMGFIILGPLFYLIDIPFKAEREYYCNRCDYRWGAD